MQLVGEMNDIFMFSWNLSDTRKTALCKGQLHALWSSIRTSIWSSVSEMQREWERNAQN